MRPLLTTLALTAMCSGLAAHQMTPATQDWEATPVAASRVVQFAQVEYTGGFTAFSDTITFAARVTGREIQAGFVRIEREYHTSSGTLVMTGRLTEAETEALWQALRNAEPWANAVVAATFQNSDIPDIRVTLRRNHTQLIRASFPDNIIPPEVEYVSAQMTSFLGLVTQWVANIADSPLFIYEADGGLLGMQRTVTITRGGGITDEVLFPSPPGAEVDPYWVQGLASFDQMEMLVALTEGWRDYPETFGADPATGDGISIDTTYYLWGRGWTVSASWPENRPTEYQDVLNHVVDMAASLP